MTDGVVAELRDSGSATNRPHELGAADVVVACKRIKENPLTVAFRPPVSIPPLGSLQSRR